jgi:hypothetical protein
MLEDRSNKIEEEQKIRKLGRRNILVQPVTATDSVLAEAHSRMELKRSVPRTAPTVYIASVCVSLFAEEDHTEHIFP